MTNKPSNLREPYYIKEFNEDNKQIKELEEFLKVVPKEAANIIQMPILRGVFK